MAYLFFRGTEFISLLWMQWQDRNWLVQHGTFTLLLGFVYDFVYYGYIFMWILPFNNSVSFLTEQQNVDVRALQNVESRCEICTLLDVLRDQLCCRMRHNRTVIRISLSHLSILYPVHLLTFHVIQFLHILTSLCRGNTKTWLFCTCPHK